VDRVEEREVPRIEVIGWRVRGGRHTCITRLTRPRIREEDGCQRANDYCASPISYPGKIWMTAGWRLAILRAMHRIVQTIAADPLRVVDTARPSARSPRPAAPVGCPRSFESALSSGRPSGLADPATRVASVAGRADAGPARDRRPVASRPVLSMVAASYAPSWKTTHRRRMPAADLSHGTCENAQGDRHRPGVHSSRIVTTSSPTLRRSGPRQALTTSSTTPA